MIAIIRQGACSDICNIIQKRKVLKQMKKRFFAILLALALAICVFPASAFADYNPYLDEVYYKDNLAAGVWGGTGARYKTNTSKVYVYPDYSPSDITLVQTTCYVGGYSTFKNVYGNASLSSHNKYAITNRVYEDGDKTGSYVNMWLSVAPAFQSGTVHGVWSPDWTGNGNVAIV